MSLSRATGMKSGTGFCPCGSAASAETVRYTCALCIEDTPGLKPPPGRPIEPLIAARVIAAQ